MSEGSYHGATSRSEFVQVYVTVSVYMCLLVFVLVCYCVFVLKTCFDS